MRTINSKVERLTMFRSTIIIVFLILLGLFAARTNAQDYGRIDTIYNVPRQSFTVLQAFGDTVLIKINIRDSTTTLWKMSIDGGQSWQTIEGDEVPQAYLPSIGIGVIGFDRINPEDVTNVIQYYWVLRQGKIVYRDTIGNGKNVGLWPIQNMVIHPLNSKLIFYKGIYDSFVAVVNRFYYSTDDGRTWQQISVPLPSEGYGWQMEIRFDYERPNVWYFGVTGNDIFLGGRNQEWHVTTDSGRTFTPLSIFDPFNGSTKLGFLNGLWGTDTYVTFPWLQQHPGSQLLSRGVPVVHNLYTDAKDTLPWMANLHNSLFRDVDTSKVTVYSLSGLQDDENGGSRFHPLSPETIIMGVTMDTLTDSGISTGKGLVITSDTGKTWQWLIRPMRFPILGRSSIDPITHTVYLAVNMTNDSLLYNREFLILKIPHAEVTGVPSNPYPLHTDLWPNPVSDVLHVSTASENAVFFDVELIDVFGRRVAYKQGYAVQASRSDITVDVAAVPTGTYFVRISDGRTTRSLPIVIVH